MSKSIQPQPFSTTFVIRLLVGLSLILAIAAGFYHEAWKLEQKKYLRLEDKYVRVRNMIGRSTMQELIDESYLLDEEW